MKQTSRLFLFVLVALFALLAVPAVRSQTVPATIVAGKKVTFSVTVEKGTPPLSYQWRKDGQPIPGATGASYVIPRVAEADAGVYSVTVTNAAGSTVSNEAPIVLIVPPSGAVVTQTVAEPDPA